VFAHTPHQHLVRALPHLLATAGATTRSPTRATVRVPGPAGDRTTAAWQPLDAHNQPARACPACILHHTHGATRHTWVYLTDQLGAAVRAHKALVLTMRSASGCFSR
jgi:hypothetical protein